MKQLISILLIASSAAIFVAQAQEEKKPEAKNQEQLTGIEWLKQFEGTWATDFDGTMRSRVVGGKWIVNEFSFQNGVFAIQTLGYDEKKQKFVGSWVDATSSHIWHYTGSLDEAGQVLMLDTEGPDLNDATKMATYIDSYEFTTPDEISAVSKILDDKKQWKTFNDGKMTRK